MSMFSLKRVAMGIILPLLLTSSGVMALPVRAADSACVVISVKGGGSLTRFGTGVRASLKKGDTIFEGDGVSLAFGAMISLAFDKSGLDVMHFEGPSKLRFITPTQIEINKGKASVILNNVRSFRSFRIKTPSAITHGRGAHFQVEVKQSESEVRAFKSKVEVFGRGDDGHEITPSVTVDTGKKTSVLEPGATPDAVVQLDSNDMREIGVIKGLTRDAVDWVNKQKGSWLKTRMELKPAETEQTHQPVAPAEGDEDGSHYLF